MAPRSEDPKLVIRVISFELTQHIVHGTSTSRTDGRTDGRLIIEISRFALRASRGKNGAEHAYSTRIMEYKHHLHSVAYVNLLMLLSLGAIINRGTDCTV